MTGIRPLRVRLCASGENGFAAMRVWFGYRGTRSADMSAALGRRPFSRAAGGFGAEKDWNRTGLGPLARRQSAGFGVAACPAPMAPALSSGP